MKNIYQLLKINPLFQNISYSDFNNIYICLEMKTKQIKKDNIILLSGDKINFIGIILSGSINIVKGDINGNENIIAKLAQNDIFGEAFVCAKINHSPVTIIANENCEILTVNFNKIISPCEKSCDFHKKLIENMLFILAQKNIMLNQKIQILSKRTTREKIITFLNIYKNDNQPFFIPFNRDEMAQFLCVDRSAMSNELCKMRDEQIIEFHKNKFKFL